MSYIIKSRPSDLSENWQIAWGFSLSLLDILLTMQSIVMSNFFGLLQSRTMSPLLGQEQEIYKIYIDKRNLCNYDLQMCFTNERMCLFPLKIVLFLREIALFYTNSNYKLYHLWSTFEGHKSNRLFNSWAFSKPFRKFLSQLQTGGPLIRWANKASVNWVNFNMNN